MKKILSAVITAIVAVLTYLLALPSLNFASGGFWCYLVWILVVFALTNSAMELFSDDDFSMLSGISGIGAGVVVVIALILWIAGTALFNSGKYASMISTTEKDFSADMVEESISSLALMDSASAKMYGNRTLTNPEWVSLYNVSNDYTQIALNGEPMKVAPLEHAGIFKAMQNSDQGILGYVKVNPVTYKAEMVELDADTAIMYSPSAVFSKDLTRHIRSEYKTQILGRTFFELDEEETPYWVTQVMDHTIGLFGGTTVKGVIVTDAHSGAMEYYSVNDVPEWVDIVYDGDLICNLFDYYGLYQNGFWNASFGQKNCKVTTDDFGYKVIGNDVYIYTGVTSVTSDEANIGFILVNSRTLEYTYYSVGGAEEYSAMSAAEGEVQQYGYKASFPSLVNVGGQPTYVMVLKDDNGLVKKYAMVNIQQYDIVTVADTAAETAANYKKLLSSKNVVSKDESMDVTVVKTTINNIEYIVVEGETVVYIKTDAGVFKKAFEESLMLLDETDSVSISYYETGSDIEYIESIQ